MAKPGNGNGALSSFILNNSYNITSKIGTFVEEYGSLNDVGANVNRGFSCLVQNDLQ
ncbi:MAG: hypothetical protein AAFV80_19165 [Bacteroidota bacterium]